MSSVSSRSARLRGVAGDEVGLVERDHERAAGLLDHAGDPRVLLGRAELGVDHEHDDVGALDLAERHRDRDLLDVGVDLRLAADAGGVDRGCSRGRRSRTACRPDRSSCRRRGGRASAPRRAGGWSATTCRRSGGRRTRRAAAPRSSRIRSGSASASSSASAVAEIDRASSSPALRAVSGATEPIACDDRLEQRVDAAAVRGRDRIRRRRGRARGSRGPDRRRSGDRSC